MKSFLIFNFLLMQFSMHCAQSRPDELKSNFSFNVSDSTQTELEYQELLNETKTGISKIKKLRLGQYDKQIEKFSLEIIQKLQLNNSSKEINFINNSLKIILRNNLLNELQTFDPNLAKQFKELKNELIKKIIVVLKQLNPVNSYDRVLDVFHDVFNKMKEEIV